MSDLFREYVTGASFNLTLKKSHIWVLAHSEAGDYHNRDQNDLAATPGHDVFIPAVRGLIDRGLVVHNPKWDKNKKPAYSLTPAGIHVVALLKLAKLIYPAKQKVSA